MAFTFGFIVRTRVSGLVWSLVRAKQRRPGSRQRHLHRKLRRAALPCTQKRGFREGPREEHSARSVSKGGARHQLNWGPPLHDFGVPVFWPRPFAELFTLSPEQESHSSPGGILPLAAVRDPGALTAAGPTSAPPKIRGAVGWRWSVPPQHRGCTGLQRGLRQGQF